MLPTTPRSVTIYGLLGLIPFLAPPLAMLLLPEWGALAGRVLALYAGLILSFLGGARFGLANALPAPPAGVISVSMLPTLVGLALLLLPEDLRTPQLVGLAGALFLHWLWDVRSRTVPSWYPWLRTMLTAGAVVGLVAGAFLTPA